MNALLSDNDVANLVSMSARKVRMVTEVISAADKYKAIAFAKAASVGIFGALFFPIEASRLAVSECNAETADACVRGLTCVGGLGRGRRRTWP